MTATPRHARSRAIRPGAREGHACRGIRAFRHQLNRHCGARARHALARRRKSSAYSDRRIAWRVPAR
ncbi:unnamed protein product (plasmid) [Mycetohabitans rhizoxinica HKI 454]|uniref:Uncharacterized protein n=1 Tax=Mycetohabitans rhizoxinica (strain DSM 19002 / CIP 109453 / HKI 454) TaxID=882378 RepID=E5ATT9_MYCRK|nr:unnamed protein product [Mycetohabitans rhizoxinica HKI 454]